MPNLLCTILQHVLEDPAHLTQSMESAVKMCWLRLSKGKTSKVSFKQLIEILAPLVHRDQQTFVQVMRTNVRLFRSDGQLLTALKDSAQRSVEAAKTARILRKLIADPDLDTYVEEKREKEAKRRVKKDKEEKEKEKATIVLTPRPSHSASASQTPVSASANKRQKTSHSDIATGGATVNPVVASSSSSSSSISSTNSGSSMAVLSGLKIYPVKAVKQHRRWQSRDVGTPHHLPTPVTVAQAVIEELLSLAVSQWARLQALNVHYTSVTGDVTAVSDESNGKTLDLESSIKFSLPPAPCHLTIAEIMLVVGDLVSVVPGLATCVHR